MADYCADTTTTRLKGKRALVTGSIQGIGLEIAKTLARAGAEVVLHGLPDEAVHACARGAIDEISGRRAISLTYDLADSDQTARMMELVLENQLDILVNNAGIRSICCPS